MIKELISLEGKSSLQMTHNAEEISPYNISNSSGVVNLSRVDALDIALAILEHEGYQVN